MTDELAGWYGGMSYINTTLKMLVEDLKTGITRGRIAVVIRHAPTHQAAHVQNEMLHTHIQER